MCAVTQISLSDNYISIESRSNAKYIANEIVHACYDDLSNSISNLQCLNNIEKKLRALMLAIEHSFDIYDESALDNHTPVDFRTRTTRSVLINNLHYECSVVKFGISPMPGVGDLYRLWSMLVHENRVGSSYDGDILIVIND